MNLRNVLDVVDLHAAGEPLRIVTNGYPKVSGRTVLEKRHYIETHLDNYRKRLMFEPWGHSDMYGCLLVEPEREDSLYGLIFMHNDGYSTMCGHATIAVTTWLVETGQLEIPAGGSEVSVKYDVPSGQIVAHTRVAQDRVTRVWFENVPAFVVALDRPLSIKGYDMTIDVAFGGAYYAIVPSRQLDLAVTPEAVDDLRQWAQDIKEALRPSGLAAHPLDHRLDGLYGVIFTDAPHNPANHSRNLTIFAQGQVDRSPCGSCLSARLAVLDAKGLIQRHETYVVESVIGTTFSGAVVGDAESSASLAVRTVIEGEAHITGFRRFYVDPADPVQPFLIR